MKDLLVIGGGPGGYVAAIRARQLGMKVTLVEKDKLGGTCLHRGCIPTKTYYRHAEMMRSLQRLGEFCIKLEASGPASLDMAGARARKNAVVEQMADGVSTLLQSYGVEVIRGEASLEGAGQVRVGKDIIEADRLLIATGSESIRPANLPGVDLPGVLNCEELLDCRQIPERLLIIGGGVIGMEFACIFQAFGSRVTVLEALPRPLAFLDQEIARRMGALFKRQGIAIKPGVKVESIVKQGDKLLVTAGDKKGTSQYEADLLLLAVGRSPATARLNLEQLGVKTERGFIQVNQDYASNVPGIYAIGDVIGPPMLAHVASEEGRIAVERMAGLDTHLNYQAIPHCIFTFPEIAAVGLSQEEAQSQGEVIKIGKFPFAANGKAVAMGESEGLVKVICSPDDKVLGVHIMGPHASDLILEASFLVSQGLQVETALHTVHPHPTLGETLYEALLDVQGRAIHLKPKRS